MATNNEEIVETRPCPTCGGTGRRRSKPSEPCPNECDNGLVYYTQEELDEEELDTYDGMTEYEFDYQEQESLKRYCRSKGIVF